jgi:hypothetical protein
MAIHRIAQIEQEYRLFLQQHTNIDQSEVDEEVEIEKPVDPTNWKEDGF